jgi:eukaryotic-like serine/threonine-protein kinase
MARHTRDDSDGAGAGLYALTIAAIILALGVGFMVWKIATRDVAVPNLSRMNEAQASDALAAAKLQLGSTSHVATRSIGVGLIITQTPPAGATAQRNSRVDVSTAVEPTAVKVPDVAGKTKAAAESALASWLFYPITDYGQYSATVPAGTVVSTLPSAGTPTISGTQVVMLVSLGEGVGVAVPNVVGMPLPGAAQALAAAGLEPVWLYDNVSQAGSPGTVLAQAPEPGTAVPAGASVAVRASHR